MLSRHLRENKLLFKSNKTISNLEKFRKNLKNLKKFITLKYNSKLIQIYFIGSEIKLSIILKSQI